MSGLLVMNTRQWSPPQASEIAQQVKYLSHIALLLALIQRIDHDEQRGLKRAGVQLAEWLQNEPIPLVF